MGCLARLGCLILVICGGVAAWLTRDRWLPKLTGRTAPPPRAAAVANPWEPLSQEGADRTIVALQRLSQPRGPVFATLSGADVASYVFLSLAKQLPPSTDSLAASVNGDRIGLRASVRLSDLSGAGSVGPLASLFGDRAPVQLTGTLKVIKSGLAEFQVQDLTIRTLTLPRGMIPQILTQLSHAPRPPGVDQDALPMPIPPYVGDVRVSRGQITLYKSVD